MRRLALGAAIGLLAACGTASTDDDPQGQSSSRSPTTSGEFSCGEVVLAQGAVLEVAGAEERDCLEAALRDGRSAGLKVTEPTVEGDPIVTSWRLLADRTLSAEVDSSQDRFGGDPAVTHVTCGQVTELPTPLRCEPSA